MSSPVKKKVRDAEARTRRAILDLLKREGPKDARELAEALEVSAMAVRHHLYGLQDEKLVTYAEEPRPLGRPAKKWRLTPKADRFFPSAHAELTVALIQATKEAFGPEGLEKILALRARQQIAAYGRAIPAGAPLGERLEALAGLRTGEGYMAEVLVQEDGTFLLVENHCPICTAASACQNLCGKELEVFQTVLGETTSVERLEHILSGARRCAYKIEIRD